MSTFRPPSIDMLSSVDVADCSYGTDLEEITGVISLDSQGGWDSSGDYQVHCFSFAAWRRKGGNLVNRNLTILRPVAPGSKYFAEYPEATIHRIQVLLSVDESRAVFANVLERNVADVEMLALAAELQAPVTIETKRFGELTLNRRVNWFEGRATWNGESVEISFEVDSDDLDITKQLETAEALFNDSKSWAKQIGDFAIKEKLDIANDWCDENEEPISAAEFLRRIKLESISIGAGGRLEFWHQDDDMFGGHLIQISGSLQDGLSDSDMPG